MGELGRLIRDYRATQKYPVSDSQIARAIGVTRSTVGNWIRGDAMPSPANLRALAHHIETPYSRVLDAALADAGYLWRETRHDDTAPITHAGESPADELARRRGAPEAGQDSAVEREAARHVPPGGSMRAQWDAHHGSDDTP